jgi:hypothetical protein
VTTPTTTGRWHDLDDPVHSPVRAWLAERLFRLAAAHYLDVWQFRLTRA